MKKACYNCEPSRWQHVFAPSAHTELQQRVDFGEQPIPMTESVADLIERASGAELMFTTWGALPLTAEVLDNCPELRCVIHGAGSVKQFVTDEVTERGIVVSSGAAINGKAVAEFCLGVILTALKDVYRYPFNLRKRYEPVNWWSRRETFKMGYYQSKVGLIGFGNITRSLLELLRPFELDVYVSSEYFLPEDEVRYGARRAESDWIFSNCEIVSLHSSDTPRNWNQVSERTLGLMKDGAYLLNTGRGRLVDEAALLEALRTRDLVAILDVTYPEPPAADNPLFRQDNCFILPHVSGSLGREVERLGNFVIEEVDRYLAGQALQGEVNLGSLSSNA